MYTQRYSRHILRGILYFLLLLAALMVQLNPYILVCAAIGLTAVFALYQQPVCLAGFLTVWLTVCKNE